MEVEDRRLAGIVEQCRDLPGYELFQYRDTFGEIHSIDSSDVNAYIREAAGEDLTAKDFRTWTGTVLTAVLLAETGRAETRTQAVAVVETYLEGRPGELPVAEAGSAAATDELAAEEKWVLTMIRSEAAQVVSSGAAA